MTSSHLQPTLPCSAGRPAFHFSQPAPTDFSELVRHYLASNHLYVAYKQVCGDEMMNIWTVKRLIFSTVIE